MQTAVARAVVAAALFVAFQATAQPTPQKLPRVGFCDGFGNPDHVFHKTFVFGMRNRGWEDGRNVRIVIPEGTITKEMVRLRSCEDYMADKGLDVVVMEGFSNPNSKVPVVTALRNVAGSPLAKSTTRNVTGITEEEHSLVQTKRMALLKEALGARTIAFIYARPAGPKVKPGIGRAEDLPAEIREAAAQLGVEAMPINFTAFEDFEPAFKIIAAKPRAALIFHTGMYWYKIRSNDVAVDQFIEKHRLPMMLPQPDWVQANNMTMIAYGVSFLERMERYSYFVDRILRGAKPAELPFEQLPNRLAINLDAAKSYGITVPHSVLLQADVVVPYDPRFDWVPPESQSQKKQ